MNNRLSLAFGQSYVRIPLEGSPHILNADALETDWTALLPPEECSYVFGNPPFGGAKFQNEEQRAQVRRIAALGKTGGTLDYVTAWFIKAGEYVQTGRARIGFVATNSITQGEQVAQLWPILFTRSNLEIAFAHRTFAWGSDARGKAHVHVVIIGLDDLENTQADKRLFSYPNINGEPEETLHAALSPYLFDAGGLADPHLVVREESRPINGMGKLKTGVQMIDNGILTFNEDGKEAFLASEPDAFRFFRRYIGGDEFINGFHRWILYLREATPGDLKRLPMIARKVAEVRAYRAVSKRASTQKMADYPTFVGVDERLETDLSGYSEYKLRTSRVCTHRLAWKRCYRKSEVADSPGCDSSKFRSSHLNHAHGLDADSDRAHEKRLHVFRWCRLQHLPCSACGYEPAETGTARASRARRPRCPSGRYAGRLSTIPT